MTCSISATRSASLVTSPSAARPSRPQENANAPEGNPLSPRCSTARRASACIILTSLRPEKLVCGLLSVCVLFPSPCRRDPERRFECECECGVEAAAQCAAIHREQAYRHAGAVWGGGRARDATDRP